MYKVVLADPPYEFTTWSDKANRSAKRHYQGGTMTRAEIMALGSLIAPLAAPGCALFLWGTSPNLPDMLAVMEAWGFRYTTKAFGWAKRSPTGRTWHFANGYYTRANTEDCWLGIKIDRHTRTGRPVVTVPTRKSRGIAQLIVAPVAEHSRKPDEAHERIEDLFDGPYLELFGRRTRPGWTVLGDELGGRDIAVDLADLAAGLDAARG